MGEALEVFISERSTQRVPRGREAWRAISPTSQSNAARHRSRRPKQAWNPSTRTWRRYREVSCLDDKRGDEGGAAHRRLLRSLRLPGLGGIHRHEDGRAVILELE